MVRNDFYKNHYIIEQVLAMDEKELSKFLEGLTSEAQEYLDIILAKAEGRLPQLKNYLDSQ